jgi:Na+-driven multidrug efflux pump
VLVTAMVGNFGAVSLAAVGLATMVQFSSAMIFAAAGTGAAAIVAREAGAGNWAGVRTITGTGPAAGTGVWQPAGRSRMDAGAACIRTDRR